MMLFAASIRHARHDILITLCRCHVDYAGDMMILRHYAISIIAAITLPLTLSLLFFAMMLIFRFFIFVFAATHVIMVLYIAAAAMP